MAFKYFKIFLCGIIILSFTGCLERVCNETFYVDNGIESKERFTMPENIDYSIGIDIEDTIINISVFTSSNKSFVKDRGVVLNVKDMLFILKKSKDTLVRLDESTMKYSCLNFKEKIKEENEVYFKFIYSIDSLGVIKNFTKEYNLIKRKDCHFMFRVH